MTQQIELGRGTTAGTGGARVDIVLFGATGYTGELTAEYLARAMMRERFRWVIAGRDLQKLERLKKRLCAINPVVRQELGILVADTGDAASLERLAKAARVVLTAVGPYVHHGEALVQACIDQGTDYADLSGEPEFVNAMLQRHGKEAREKRLRIVNCCGFDSVPHDVGVYYTIQQLAKRLGVDTVAQSEVRVEGFVRVGGGVSGGTWHSAIHALSKVGGFLGQKPGPDPADGESGRKIGGLFPTLRYRDEIAAWALPFPTIDPQVVKRSALALEEYGEQFNYGHYLQVTRLPVVLMGVAAVAGLLTLAQLAPARNWLLGLKEQGSGPRPGQRARGFFAVRFAGYCDGLKLVTEVSGGDPGYDESAKMLAETGLCLALDRRGLPRHFGVITPVTAMGKRLLHRLEMSDMRFEVISEEDYE